MKRFKFRLERVLQYRETIKEEKKGELRKQQLILSQAEERLEFLKSEQLRNEPQDSDNDGQLQLKAMYASRLKQSIAEQLEVIAMQKLKVEQALQQYIEATKDASALVKLKERKLAEYQQYSDSEDAKFLDELSVQARTRKELWNAKE